MNKTQFSLALILMVFAACNKHIDPPAQVPPPVETRINVKNYGAKGDGSTDDNAAILAAFAAGHDKHLPVYFPAGKYVAKVVISYDSLTITGEKANSLSFDSAGTVILGLINCNYKKNIVVSNLNVDSRSRLNPNEASAITSGDNLGDQPLNQTFNNLAILGDGYLDYRHGILCQAGSDIRITNIYVANFYHGVAIRCSNVFIDSVNADYCGFTSVVVKSAGGLNKLTQNVTVKNINIKGDPADVYRRGGVVLIQSYNNESLTQNITVDNVRSSWGGVGVVNVEQAAGSVQNVSISNSYGEYCGDNPIRAAFDINGGTNITYTNCKTVNCFGVGFRSINNPVNLVVQGSFEKGSTLGAWAGTYKYLQLNGVEIIK